MAYFTYNTSNNNRYLKYIVSKIYRFAYKFLAIFFTSITVQLFYFR